MKAVFISDFNDERFVLPFKAALREFSVNTERLDEYISDFNKQGNIFSYALMSESGEAAGIIQFQLINEPREPFSEPYGYIREFWIDRRYRGQGWGAFLLKKAEEYFIKNGILKAALSSRSEAEGFYKKQGYIKKDNLKAANGMAIFEKQL